MNNTNFLKNIRIKSDSYWNNILIKKRYEIFYNAINSVPAYKKFLINEGYNTKKKKLKDFNFLSVPIMTKNNYLKKYPLPQLVHSGKLSLPLVLTSTSGSTGEPFYFPRTKLIDEEYSYIIERFINEGGVAKNEPTLVLICFGMGVWIGGVITYQAFEMASRRSNLPISILTPGINKAEIIKSLRNIAPNYKNLIIVGYPPFVKDVIDESIEQGINFSKYNVRFIFAAEVFTEKFRDYICKKTHVKNIYKDILAIYGSADIGAMAWETGVLVLLKRILQNKQSNLSDFFGSNHAMPTIGYFNPNWLQFEECDGKVLISGENAIPFIRYGIGDKGGVLTFSEIVKRLRSIGIDFDSEVKKAKLDESVLKLPCVYVYERDDLSITLYGLQIYPEVIREALIDNSFNKYITGKFLMETKFDNNQDQYIEIIVEMKKGITGISLKVKQLVFNSILKNLHKKNSEFVELEKNMGKRAYPRLIFTENGNENYFKSGIKQKWVKK